MLILDERLIILTGAAGLVFMMLAAVATHIKVKNNISHALPAISQIVMNGLIFYLTY